MKTTKRIISALLAICALLSVAACTESAETEEKTDEATETAPDTEVTEPVQTELVDDAVEGDPDKETTARPRNIATCSLNDGVNSDLILIYCEVEHGATVYIRDGNGTLLLKEKAVGPCFYGTLRLEEGKKKYVFISAMAEGKNVSSPDKVTLRHEGEAGHSTFVGKNSRLYYTEYDSMYKGLDAAAVTDEMINNVDGYLRNKLDAVRAETGKDTKIIIVVCTNPATINHDLQYPEDIGGRGDYLAPSPSTMLAEHFENDEDIYYIDLRDILLEHKDEMLFYQGDTHWTPLAGYYAYTEVAAAVKRDFPSVSTFPLSKYTVDYGYRNGDLLIFTGGANKGMRFWGVDVRCEFKYRLSTEAPTAYVMGDSYYWSISGFLPQIFKKIYLNSPEENPPLYDYSLNDLSEKKPDYLFYIWTERNITSDFGIIFN